VIVLLAGVAVWHEAHYHEWPIVERGPSRLSYCGRSYKPARGLPATTRPEKLYFAFRFRPLLASHHDVYSEMPIVHEVGTVGTMVLWVHLHGGYVSYALDGGP
jgi:hypothetical protein